MPERVEIVVTANDAASQILRGIGSQLGGLGNAISAIANGDIVGLTSQVIDFGKESIKAFTDGAQAAKQLSMVSGDSIENASRFIQVLDDYELSQQDAMAATKAMTKEGLTPNLETLAKLSDQYKAIQDPQQKNEFILKNLGKAGLQWAKVLDQGSEALLDQADAIDKNLIFTEEMYQQSEMLRLAQDNLNDQWEATKVQIGSALVPVLNDLLTATNNNIEANGRWSGILYAIPIYGQIKAIRDLGNAHDENLATIEARTQQEKALGEATQKTAEEMRMEQEAVRALTQQNSEYLSIVGELSGNLTNYESQHQAIQDELNAGNITLTEAQQQWAKLAEEQEQATYKMILNMLQQRLAEDGLSEAETQFLLNQGVQWGIYSQAAVTKAGEVISQVDEMVAKYSDVPPVVSTDIVTNHYDNYFTNVHGEAGFSDAKAGGGDVNAGTLYRVNETRMEYFRPSMSGTVIPLGSGGGKGGGGDTFNIVLSPTVMVGDRSRAANELLPIIIDGVRKAKADRII